MRKLFGFSPGNNLIYDYNLMIIKNFVTAFGLILAIFANSLAAETLIEVFDLARKNDPEWAAKKLRYLADQEKVRQAWGTLLPQIAFSGSWGQQRYEGENNADLNAFELFGCVINELGSGDPVTAEDISDCQSFANERYTRQTYTAIIYDLTLNQPLYRWDRWQAYKQAKVYDKAAKAQLAAGRQDLLIRTAESYFTVLRAQEEEALALAERKTLDTQLKEIKNRYQLGLARDTDLFEIQAQYDLADAAVIVAQSQVEASRESLALMTGTYLLELPPLPDSLIIEAPQPADLTEWEDYAKTSNYELLATRFNVEAAKHNVSEEKAGHRPSADLFLRYENRDVGGGFTPPSETTTVGVKVQVPLYSGGITAAKVREAQNQLGEAEQQSELALRKALLDIRRFHSQVRADVISVQARSRAVRSNNSAFRAIKAGWEDGTRVLTDVLTAQRKAYQARKELTTARFDYVLNTFRLKRAAGSLQPSDLENINSSLNDVSSSGSAVELDPEVDYQAQQSDADPSSTEAENAIGIDTNNEIESLPGERNLFEEYKRQRQIDGN